MAGAAQALDRLTLANGHFEIQNDATQRRVVYKDFAVVFDHSGSTAHATISATGPAGPWSVSAQASDGDAPALSVEARDLSLADLQAFDKRPPPLTAEGPIAIKIEAEVTPQSTLRTFTSRFNVGAGRVRFNNPDAVPFFIDEASGAIAWDEDARRYRVDRLEVLSGLTHVNMQGSLAPPADADRVWTAHLEARDAQFSPERAGGNPVELESIVLDARFLTVVAGSSSTASPPAGRRSTLRSRRSPLRTATARRSSSILRPAPAPRSDLIRLWPQFINPDVREWCAHNLHGGRLQGTMKADWTAADLDAMAHKRGLPRESLHGEFTTRDVGVDLMPGLPMMMTDEGVGVVHRP